MSNHADHCISDEARLNHAPATYSLGHSPLLFVTVLVFIASGKVQLRRDLRHAVTSER